jgi:hypothetical protein
MRFLFCLQKCQLYINMFWKKLMFWLHNKPQSDTFVEQCNLPLYIILHIWCIYSVMKINIEVSWYIRRKPCFPLIEGKCVCMYTHEPMCACMYTFPSASVLAKFHGWPFKAFNSDSFFILWNCFPESKFICVESWRFVYLFSSLAAQALEAVNTSWIHAHVVIE